MTVSNRILIRVDVKNKPEESFQPRKRFGQNFLVDQNVAQKIIRAIDPKAEDVIIEIGPGLGMLTQYLLPKCKKLIAVELDCRLAQRLRERFADARSFHLIQGDFLEVDLSVLAEQEGPLRIIGNIPYQITSPVIFKAIDARGGLRDMILMVQREVAERVVAQPGSKDYGTLSIFSQVYARPEILFSVSRNVFRPRPEVESALVRWDFTAGLRFPIRDEATFRGLVRGVFRYRRKMLRNALREIPELEIDVEHIHVALERRPEELSVAEWVALSQCIHLKSVSCDDGRARPKRDR